uniref:CYP77F31 n=1 Tax=Taxus chinensis TaxID=29808 RepID=A0A291FAV2_TAXCH|nr:CYP77F31 [Taxus chinensis]
METFPAAAAHIYSSSSLYFLLLVLAIPLALFFLRKKKNSNLPPGPAGWPIVGNLLQIRLTGQTFFGYVEKQHKKYGGIFTIKVGSRPLIIVANRELAHEALIQKGAVFASRPPVEGMRKLFSSNQMSINSAAYGPTWRTLRRNLVSETLSPAAMKSFREGREWGVEMLMQCLKTEAEQNEGVVKVVEHLRYAAFCILLYMCFGLRLDQKTVRDVETVMRELLLSGAGLSLDDTFPVLKVFYRKRRARMEGIRRRLEETLVALINRRRAALAEGRGEECRAYVDSLFSLRVEGGRCLSDGEMVTLCSEFINAGTDTTSTTMQWVMANLVKHQNIQSKVYEEIVGVAGKERAVEEEEVSGMKYLEAVVKEALRRHSPGKFVLTHAVTEACDLGGYHFPAGTIVNFLIWEMGNDPSVWENPSEFVPERYMSRDVDMTGSKEIRMMPFGVGRRICPGLGLAMLHVELIVARLVQKFMWESKPGETVDFAEKQEFTMVMKNPLQAVIKERASA